MRGKEKNYKEKKEERYYIYIYKLYIFVKINLKRDGKRKGGERRREALIIRNGEREKKRGKKFPFLLYGLSSSISSKPFPPHPFYLFISLSSFSLSLSLSLSTLTAPAFFPPFFPHSSPIFFYLIPSLLSLLSLFLSFLSLSLSLSLFLLPPQDDFL